MSDQSQPAATPTPLSGIADPAPLGLAAFAATTFLLSAKNSDWTRGTDAWLAYAIAYGGLVQLLAGMWEFRNRNVFGATAFGTYGGFWIGLALYALFVAPKATSPAQVSNDEAWILLAFAIFNLYMLAWSTQVNEAVLAVFLTLQATLIVLVIGNFASSAQTIKVGGYLGILTAACAWYASAAGVINGMLGRAAMWVGHPLRSTPRAHHTAPLPTGR
jgi:succinate-acetate transporter protein